MSIFFGATLLAGILFYDVWFSSGYPKMFFVFIVGYGIYRLIRPYLRL